MSKIRYKECPECDGHGVVTYERVLPSGAHEDYELDCTNCAGDGWLYDDEEDEE